MINDKTTTANKDSKELEGKLQADCYQWFNNTFPQLRGLLYHVPNGEKRDKLTAAQLKAKGVVPGIPDLVFHYRAKTYFFELKSPNGKGQLSESQKKIHNQLDLQRFIVWILNDFESFKKLIENILLDTSQQFTLGVTKKDFYYKHKIFDYLYNMQDGQLVKVLDICDEVNQGKFINYITEFIVEGYDKLDGFELLFTPDYKAFYKKVNGSNKSIDYASN